MRYKTFHQHVINMIRSLTIFEVGMNLFLAAQDYLYHLKDVADFSLWPSSDDCGFYHMQEVQFQMQFGNMVILYDFAER